MTSRPFDAHHNLRKMEVQNKQLEKELASFSSHHHSSKLSQLENENAKLKTEVVEAKERQLKIQNSKLARELKSMQLAFSGSGSARTSSLASYPAPRRSSLGRSQKLAWYGPRVKYGSLGKVPGFNPLSIVTRADKSMDPDYRPPLRVSRPTKRAEQSTRLI